jgi:outer membrane protein assembly complex protein YaeT
MARGRRRSRGTAWILATAVVLCGCRASAGSQEVALAEGRVLRVRFEGVAGLSERELRRAVADDLASAARRASLRAVVDDAAYSAEVHYRRRGFPACAVEYRLEEAPDGATTAVLQVAEGPRVRIGSVRFVRPADEGSGSPAAFDAAELESFVIPPRRALLPDAPSWYVAEELENSRAALETFYQSRGYQTAEVRLLEPDPARADWQGEVEVVFEVRQGALHRLRSLSILGGSSQVDGGIDPLRLRGQVALPRLTTTLRNQLREAHARGGHPDADVRVLEQSSDGEGNVDLVLQVDPGPHVVLGQVRIEGRERTRAERIEGNLDLTPGEPFDVRDQRASFENLYRLGVFSSVSVELEPEPSATRDDGSQVRDVRVRVEEAPTTELYAEPGYGSYEQLRLTAGWRERNVLGTARTLEVEARVSQKSAGGKVGLSDARFLDSDTAASLVFFGGVREEPSYETGEAGGLFSLSRRLGERLQAALGYQYRFSEVTADDFSDPAVAPLLENANVSSLVFAPTWDARDQAFYPRHGEYARLSLEYSAQLIGSSLDFLRARWHLAHFRGLPGESVLGLSWRGGAIAPFAETDSIPIQERFFNGGESTVRAFKEDQLGPVDADGNPVGGEAFNVFTAEVRVPLAGRLESALFYDLGNVVLDVGDVGRLEDYRGGPGLGARYDLPVGPLRLDLAWNDDPQGGEPAWVLHFSVGFSF